MAVYTAEEVLEAAARGNVVLRGWGATCLLRPVPHVPCVRIMRPLAQARAVADGRTRHRRRRPRRGRDPAQRPGQCRAHARAVRRALGRSGAVRPGAQHRPPLGRHLRAADQGPAGAARVRRDRGLARAAAWAWRLQAHVRAALRANEATHGVDITIDSTRRPGRRCAASCSTPTSSARPSRSPPALPGVAAVDNQLRVMATSRLFPSARA